MLIKKSLNFTRYIMQNKFFMPNNIIFPKSRIILENYLIIYLEATRIMRKIKMTTPVTQFEKNGNMSMQFYLPSKFNLNNVPKPTKDNVKIINIEGGYYAVIKYSGRANDKNFINDFNHYLKTYVGRPSPLFLLKELLMILAVQKFILKEMSLIIQALIKLITVWVKFYWQKKWVNLELLLRQVQVNMVLLRPPCVLYLGCLV